MASIKSFDNFVSEMDRTEEIETKLTKKADPIDKDLSEVEDEAESVQEADDVTPIGIREPNSDKQRIPVYGMLEKCYEAVISEAKEYAQDAHDEHTIEMYMAENAALVAKMGVNALNEMKEGMETEAYEACLNKMAEAYSKKINECKEMKDAVDAEDVN
jgi:hypothetical protein